VAAVPPDALERALRGWLADGALDTAERHALRDAVSGLAPDALRFVRNRAFAIARDALVARPDTALAVLRGLEQVVKTLDLAVADATPTIATTAYFSPGATCLRQLQAMCRSARSSIDVCVFTVADDRLSDDLLAAHGRGVRVRLVTDNDKRHDDGSDVARLAAAGIDVREDPTPFHMHHKFAIFDGEALANGSFNWTRSASTSNFENLVVSGDPYLLGCFAGQFERLWTAFGPATAAPAVTGDRIRRPN